MYNRYIPQPDGTYRRNHIPDTPNYREPKPSVSAPVCPAQPQPIPEPKNTQAMGSGNSRPTRSNIPPRKQNECQSCGIGTFLKQLLPRNFDTADLIVVLLLLLIASDGCEDGNTALLTLVLYLFL